MNKTFYNGISINSVKTHRTQQPWPQGEFYLYENHTQSYA